jgi:hypothetical protein
MKYNIYFIFSPAAFLFIYLSLDKQTNKKAEYTLPDICFSILHVLLPLA